MVTKTAKKLKLPPNAFKEREVTGRFEDKARQLLKDALDKQGMTHSQLSEHLAAIGAPISGVAITNKISRGGFSATFLLQCMDVMGLELTPRPKR